MFIPRFEQYFELLLLSFRHILYRSLSSLPFLLPTLNPRVFCIFYRSGLEL